MYRSPDAPNFGSFAAAAPPGNPDAAIAFNPGVVYRIFSITPDEDYTAGEIDKPENVTMRRAADGEIDGAQIQVLTISDDLGDRRHSAFQRRPGDCVYQEDREAGGSVTWDVPSS